MVSPRYFTVEEATAALPEVERLLGKLRELRVDAVDATARLDALWERLPEGSHVLDELLAAQRELEHRTTSAEEVMEDLGGIGCLVRDLDLGLVDFPALAAGIEVFLCWRLGEDAIGYWHGTTEGYAGRKPLRLLPGGHFH
ncbi:MAG TPA: DUF2203 domain-containing protein [bacterium]|nr:DUF2203 domain-containing protein [bacterium]